MTSPEQRHGAQVVDQVLSESGIGEDVDLRDLLLELSSLGAGAPPAPSDELVALMAPRILSLSTHRRFRHRRLVVAAVAVAASIGVGASAAAASPEFRHSAQVAITLLVNTLAPGLGHIPGQPSLPAPASTRAPASPGTPTGRTHPSPSEKPGSTPSPSHTGLPRPEPTATLPGRPTDVIPPTSPPGQIQKPATPTAGNSDR
jgi:hypothetical protein